MTPILVGERLAHYRITAAIGAGGMGEVYRATDTMLDREAAIKLLPADLAQDKERLARFEREAKLLASLNHPNIAHVYGFERATLADGSTTHFLAMELVAGEDLAERLKRGAIPLDEALEVATQIAEALEEAHEHGIVHRDLKPANVKLTSDGKVKVLDFGLAKAYAGDAASGSSADLSQSPTLAHSGTAAGLILGTAAYMSPEQARGKAVDRRADIWAFGVLLYEMLTGRQLFAGETVSDVLAGVLKSDVDLRALPEATPFGVRQLLARCLERSPRQRLRDIGEARVALETSIAGAGTGAASALAPRGGPPARAVPAIVAAAITALVVGLVTWLAARPAEPPAPLVRSTLLIPSVFEFAISATHVVAETRDERLLLRSLDSSAAVPLPGVESGTLPFFSPDGQWIAYFSRGRLRKVATSGGPASDICEVAREGWRLDDGTPADWGPGGIVFSDREGRLLVVSPDGGAPRTILQPATGELYLRPRWIGGHRTILFTAAGRQGTGSADTSSARVMALSLEPGAQAVKVVDGRYGHFVPPRALAFVRDNALVSVRFDPAILATSGPIETVEADAPAFAVSPDGALLFREGQRPDVTYVWLDRQGREEPTGMPAGPYRYPRISPDGSRIVVPSDAGERDLWVWDVRQKALARLTTEKGLDSYPVWMPDGRQIVYAAEVAGGYQNLAIRSADGVGAHEMLTKSERHQTPYTISPDGRLVVFRDEVPGEGTNLGVLDLQKREAKPLIATRFNERNAEISPDGRLIAYQSDEAGEYEVFVRPFPNVDAGKKQISSGGGRRPVWSRDGRRLFFEATSAAATVQVSERKGDGLDFERAHTVFDKSPFVESPLIGRTYDLGADGRFLMAKRGDQAAKPPDLTLVLNWARHLAANRP